MNILLIEAGKYAREAEINDDLKSMQKAVGGYIEVIYPFDDLVGIVCNEEGKLLGLDLNRALKDENNEIYDVIAGTFFICGLNNEDGKFISLLPKYMKKYKEMFYSPELIYKKYGETKSMKVNESVYKSFMNKGNKDKGTER